MTAKMSSSCSWSAASPSTLVMQQQGAWHGDFLHGVLRVQAVAALLNGIDAASFSVCSWMLLYQWVDDERREQGERSPPILSQHIKELADISNSQAQEFIVLISEQCSVHKTAVRSCPRYWHLSRYMMTFEGSSYQTPCWLKLFSMYRCNAVLCQLA